LIDVYPLREISNGKTLDLPNLERLNHDMPHIQWEIQISRGPDLMRYYNPEDGKKYKQMANLYIYRYCGSRSILLIYASLLKSRNHGKTLDLPNCTHEDDNSSNQWKIPQLDGLDCGMIENHHYDSCNIRQCSYQNRHLRDTRRSLVSGVPHGAGIQR